MGKRRIWGVASQDSGRSTEGRGRVEESREGAARRAGRGGRSRSLLRGFKGGWKKKNGGVSAKGLGGTYGRSFRRRRKASKEEEDDLGTKKKTIRL